MAAMNQPLATSRRLVVKIGSALLVDKARGTLRREWLRALADDVARLCGNGAEVLIVSSGAIALGRGPLGLKPGALMLEDQQAAAATGQIRLAHAYQEELARHDITVAQILLTASDTEERRRYLNARNTVERLLTRRAVPVINENDTVATEEIRFGENDGLAARVAAMIGADCLVLLSDIDGLYTADPGEAGAEFVSEVARIDKRIEQMASGSRTNVGSGGMVTKIAAAKIATRAGCTMAIADGRELNPLTRLLEGARCTWFAAQGTPDGARKRWIAGSLKPAGSIRIDAGAAAALRSGKSLLPAGVTGIEGRFQRGDAVVVRDADGAELARGLSAYSADDAARIKGHRSKEIAAILGYAGRHEMIHRDDLAFTG
ncbi:MAG: glutamate 5-kinase [Alphaproteobacteria bacterium]